MQSGCKGQGSPRDGCQASRISWGAVRHRNPEWEGPNKCLDAPVHAQEAAMAHARNVYHVAAVAGAPATRKGRWVRVLAAAGGAAAGPSSAALAPSPSRESRRCWAACWLPCAACSAKRNLQVSNHRSLFRRSWVQQSGQRGTHLTAMMSHLRRSAASSRGARARARRRVLTRRQARPALSSSVSRWRTALLPSWGRREGNAGLWVRAGPGPCCKRCIRQAGSTEPGQTCHCAGARADEPPTPAPP